MMFLALLASFKSDMSRVNSSLFFSLRSSGFPRVKQVEPGIHLERPGKKLTLLRFEFRQPPNDLLNDFFAKGRFDDYTANSGELILREYQSRDPAVKIFFVDHEVPSKR